MTPLPQEARDRPAAERAAYAAVDDALRSFPLLPAPPSLAPAVLAALRAPERAPVARPVFRLSWMDFALSGLVALMLALVWLLSGWLTPTAGRLQTMVAGPLLQTDALVWGLALAGLVVTAGLLVIAGFVFRQPQPLRRI
jgi:hypothetical protein